MFKESKSSKQSLNVKDDKNSDTKHYRNEFNAQWFFKLESMFNYADKQDPKHSFYVMREIKNENFEKQQTNYINGKRKQPAKLSFRVFASYVDLDEWHKIYKVMSKNSRTCYEVIKTNQPCHGHFDIEWLTEITKECKGLSQEQEMNRIKSLWNKHIGPAYAKLCEAYDDKPIDLDECAINTGSRIKNIDGKKYWKSSYHITVHIVSFENEKVQKQFVERSIMPNLLSDSEFKSPTPQKEHDLKTREVKNIWKDKCILDTQPYRNNTSMRMNSSHKFDDNVDMVMVSDYGKSRDMYISLIEDEEDNDLINMNDINELFPNTITNKTDNQKKVKVQKLKSNDETILNEELKIKLFAQIEQLIKKAGDNVSYPVNIKGSYIECNRNEGTRRINTCNKDHESNRCWIYIYQLNLLLIMKLMLDIIVMENAITHKRVR